VLDHLIAVLAFAGVCAALYGVQRLAGDDAGAAGCAGGGPGCGGGCRGEGGACPHGATGTEHPDRRDAPSVAAPHRPGGYLRLRRRR
jgi:hypothetical protein